MVEDEAIQERHVGQSRFLPQAEIRCVSFSGCSTALCAIVGNHDTASACVVQYGMSYITKSNIV